MIEAPSQQRSSPSMTNPMRDVERLARAIFEGANEYYGKIDPTGWEDEIGNPKEDAARDEFRALARHVMDRLSAEWRPDPDTVEVCAQAIERMPISPMWSGWYRKEAEKARAKAVTAIRSLRSLSNHPSAEKI